MSYSDFSGPTCWKLFWRTPLKRLAATPRAGVRSPNVPTTAECWLFIVLIMPVFWHCVCFVSFLKCKWLEIITISSAGKSAAAYVGSGDLLRRKLFLFNSALQCNLTKNCVFLLLVFCYRLYLHYRSCWQREKKDPSSNSISLFTKITSQIWFWEEKNHQKSHFLVLQKSISVITAFLWTSVCLRSIWMGTTRTFSPVMCGNP